MKRNNTKHPPARGPHRRVGTPAAAGESSNKGSRRVLAWLRRNFGLLSITLGLLGAFAMCGVSWSGMPWWASLETAAFAFFFLGMGVGWNVRNERDMNIRDIGPSAIMRCREGHERDRW